MIDRVLRGIVHGNSIEVRDDAGLIDGAEVEIIVRRVTPGGLKPGDGYRRTEGALVDDPEWDAIMEKIAESRKTERPALPDDE